MSTDIKFYVMHDRNTGDVEFVESGNRLRMKDLMFKGYANIGSGLCRDVSELNRGICSNMRGMYEFQVRQNTLLKKELERALMLLKEVHRISDLMPGTAVREQHKAFPGVFEQDDSVTPHPPQAVPLSRLSTRSAITDCHRQSSPLEGKAGFGFGHLIKDFWEDVN